jgi:hypothetical protein
MMEGHDEPIDVSGVTFDFRLSPELGLLQQRTMFVTSRARPEWRLQGPVGPNV